MNVTKYKEIVYKIENLEELIKILPDFIKDLKYISDDKKNLLQKLLDDNQELSTSKMRSKLMDVFGHYRRTQIEYWLSRGYSRSESKKIQSQNSTNNSLDSFIRKYGSSEGKQKYEEFRQKRKRMMTAHCEDI